MTYQDALGYVTELLSGDYNTAFGRSSHHQVWSQAMVVTSAVRGLLSLETRQGARLLRFAPQPPADWDRVEVLNVATGDARYDIVFMRGEGENRIVFERHGDGAGVAQIVVAPALPLDAVVRSVTVNGQPATFEVTRRGDVQRAQVTIEAGAARTEVVYTYDPGTDVYVHQAMAPPGSKNQGLRVLRSRAEDGALHLLVEGRGGRTYTLYARTPHQIDGADGVTVTQEEGEDAVLEIAFEGPDDDYVRRAIRLPLRR